MEPGTRASRHGSYLEFCPFAGVEPCLLAVVVAQQQPVSFAYYPPQQQPCCRCEVSRRAIRSIWLLLELPDVCPFAGVEPCLLAVVVA